MMMMRSRSEARRGMTLRADVVTWRPKLARMRIVAIGTGHARRKHLALQEGAEFEDFVALLSVRVIKGRLEQGRVKGVVETRDARGVVRELRAPRVAAGADENLLLRLQRGGARGLTIVVDRPAHAAPLVETAR